MQTVVKSQILTLQNFCKLLGDERFFPHFKTNVSRNLQDQIHGQNQGQKIIAPKQVDSENFKQKWNPRAIFFNMTPN